MKNKKQEGRRVIHRSLDDQRSGAAKAGTIIEEPIGDDVQKLVIAQFDDSARPEAFDQRELLDIGNERLSNNVSMLYPRHLLALLKKPVVLGAFISALLIGFAARTAIDSLSLAEWIIWPILAISLIVVLIVGKGIDRLISEE